MRAFVVALVLCVAPVMAVSQMSSGPQAAVGTKASPAQSLDVLLTVFEKDIVPAAKAMPAEKYDFAPSAATFATGSPEKFDTVRTFGQQVAHVAEANYYFYSTLSGLKPDMDMSKIDKMVKKDEAVMALEMSIAYAHRAIATITAENAFVTIKGADGMNTRATLAAFGAAHGYDHYGQMVEYLRMNGIVPPSSAK
jgi:uncharacterized damage-inducible protein DinB